MSAVSAMLTVMLLCLFQRNKAESSSISWLISMENKSTGTAVILFINVLLSCCNDT